MGDVVNDRRTTVASSFGPTYNIEPSSRHTHTIIFLHGRGSTGEEFAEELLDSKLTDQKTLPERLPGWRWVFPSSREAWSTVFEEQMPAWFDAHSLTDVTERQDLQAPGIRESVSYLRAILENEIERLGGRAERLVLGGISQGAAIGLWTLLCTDDPARRLGGFVGASTWLPFAVDIDNFLSRGAGQSHKAGPGASSADAFVESMMAETRDFLSRLSGGGESMLSTPVFLGHGVDDAYVDVELGRQAREGLRRIGFTAEWKEYSGAEQEGHWLKVPEEVDDMARFLEAVMSRPDVPNN